MNKIYLKFALCALILFFFNKKSYGQEVHPFSCFPSAYTNIDINLPEEVLEIIKEKQIRFETSRQNLQLNDKKKSSNDCYIIPYIVHVFHDGETVGEGANISALQIQSQIDYANNYFVENCAGIKLVPAVYNEDNVFLQEPGINRIQPTSPFDWIVDGLITSTSLFNIVQPMYTWNPYEYFNIYLLNGISGGTINSDGDVIVAPGFSRYPISPMLEAIDLPPNLVPVGHMSTDTADGVYVCNKLFTSPEFGGPSLVTPVPAPDNFTYAPAEVFMHEFGHWLGLRHIDGGGNCDVDDQCNDTTVQSINWCEPPTNCDICESCDGPIPGDIYNPFPVSNYMSSHAGCLTEYTDCQIGRMLDALATDPMRHSVTQSGKAGTQVTCAPICNLDVSINNLPFSTGSSSPITLAGSPSGGTFSGPGVIFSAFNPSIAGPGQHTITYTYEDCNGCIYIRNHNIFVFSFTYNFVSYNLGSVAPRYGNEPIPVLDDGLPLLKDDSQLVINTTSPSNYVVTVAEVLSGEVLFKTKIEAQTGTQYTGITPFKGLRNGVYVITIRNEDEVISKKGYKL